MKKFIVGFIVGVLLIVSAEAFCQVNWGNTKGHVKKTLGAPADEKKDFLLYMDSLWNHPAWAALYFNDKGKLFKIKYVFIVRINNHEEFKMFWNYVSAKVSAQWGVEFPAGANNGEYARWAASEAGWVSIEGIYPAETPTVILETGELGEDFKKAIEKMRETIKGLPKEK